MMNNKPLRIMIIDDEQSVRGLLKICLHWDEFGMEIVGEAASGIEAIELVENIKPDIIFTDICMPFMDGMEFSRIVAEQYPNIKIVVLTAHEEFEYAKKGIKIGISDFLLKPINREEIRKVVLKLKEKIEGERIKKNEYERLKKNIEESFPFLKEKFLNELIQNNHEAGYSEEKLAYFGLSQTTKLFQLAVMETVTSDTVLDSFEQRLILGIQCVELIQHYYREDIEINIFFDNSRRIVLLNMNQDIDLQNCAEQIKSMIINRLKCYISIGIGNTYSDLKHLGQSYREACDALNYKLHVGWNTVICYSNICINTTKCEIKTSLIDEIGPFIKAEIAEKAVGIVDQVFADIYLDKEVTIEQIRVTASNMVSVIFNAITELGINYKEIFEVENLPYQVIFRIDNLPEMKDYINTVVLKTISTIKWMREKKNISFIQKVMEYMQIHLAETELSLVQVAQHFYINSSYLSRLFKQETAQSFVEYLTKIRMEKAISLLRDTDMKGYQIADNIGIQDPNYFSICFKKFTGMSVNDYKKNL